ncbi:hypothetical protein Bca4012_077670 [Brassica carinata]
MRLNTKEKVKIRMFNEHPFWKERYCPDHDSDGTHKCFSCERLEPRETNFVELDDGRRLCLECMDSAVMDTYEVQPLHFEIREFFEGLNMKIEREFPFLLVEKQALNKAEEEEKIDNEDGVVTRGICLSEEQIVTSVSKGPKLGPNKQLIGKTTESQKVVSGCPVTAILILYGLPRLLTGYILAHEMMHAYLRLNGCRNLNTVMEEGICQVLGHMWTPSEANAGKKGEWSEFEKKLVEFCKNQIETDESAAYGDGFRKVDHMVTNSSLKDTLKEILRRANAHQVFDYLFQPLVSRDRPNYSLKPPSSLTFVVKNALRSTPSLASAWSIFKSLRKISPQLSYESETLHAFATVLAKFQRSSQLKSLIGVVHAGKFGHVQFSFMKFQVLEEYGNLPKMNPPRSMCGGCNSESEHGRSVDVFGILSVSEKKHPFWEERYCPAYESDGTPKCFSCERLEDYQYEVVTRGICLSEAQTIITSVSKRPGMGPHNQLIDMVTDSQRVVRDCEVTAILILYGLPRLMTGYILAHEMMHAYLRLNGYRNLNTVMEEGICQVLGA